MQADSDSDGSDGAYDPSRQPDAAGSRGKGKGGKGKGGKGKGKGGEGKGGEGKGVKNGDMGGSNRPVTQRAQTNQKRKMKKMVKQQQRWQQHYTVSVGQRP
jgi:hypothetical protein